MSYFHRVHEVQLNSQGRMVIPAQFRKDAPDEILYENDFWITPDPDGCLIARPTAVWNNYINQIKKSQMNFRDKKKYIRLLHAMVNKTHIDRQNRIAISSQLRKNMGLAEDHGNVTVVVVGADTNFEIWTEERFEGKEQMLESLKIYSEKFEDTISDDYNG